MEAEMFFRKLYCPLTPDEMVIRGGELAAKMEERERVENEFAEVKQTFKARLEGVGKETLELKQTVLERRERRDVECFNDMDFENDRVKVIRTDTNEVVETRRMTDSERQAFLPLLNETLRKLDTDGDKGRA
jgi:hypothetical protein